MKPSAASGRYSPAFSASVASSSTQRDFTAWSDHKTTTAADSQRAGDDGHHVVARLQPRLIAPDFQALRGEALLQRFGLRNIVARIRDKDIEGAVWIWLVTRHTGGPEWLEC